jgi:N-acetylmuramoyl-L-alanine amidase
MPTLNATVLVRHLPYVNALAPRRASSIDLVVIHCTELPDLAEARRYGERIHYPESGTGNSGHYYVERNGDVEEWVPPERIAHHVRGFNPRSVGVELVNRGRFPDWYDSRRQAMTQPYPQRQIGALAALLERLMKNIPTLCWIAGHDMLDREQVPASDDPDKQVRRKLDPGPVFPWDAVLSSVPLELFPGDSSEHNRSD